MKWFTRNVSDAWRVARDVPMAASLSNRVAVVIGSGGSKNVEYRLSHLCTDPPISLRIIWI
jgi:hypothetical protein